MKACIICLSTLFSSGVPKFQFAYLIVTTSAARASTPVKMKNITNIFPIRFIKKASLRFVVLQAIVAAHNLLMNISDFPPRKSYRVSTAVMPFPLQLLLRVSFHRLSLALYIRPPLYHLRISVLRPYSHVLDSLLLSCKSHF